MTDDAIMRCEWKMEDEVRCSRPGKPRLVKRDHVFTDSGSNWQTSSLATGRAKRMVLCKQHIVAAWKAGYDICPN